MQTTNKTVHKFSKADIMHMRIGLYGKKESDHTTEQVLWDWCAYNAYETGYYSIGVTAYRNGGGKVTITDIP